MTVDLTLLPWPCAICDASGTLREMNSLWQSRFGAARELETALPSAHQQFCRRLGAARSPARARALFFDCAVRAPGELAPIALRFAALSQNADAAKTGANAGANTNQKGVAGASDHANPKETMGTDALQDAQAVAKANVEAEANVGEESEALWLVAVAQTSIEQGAMSGEAADDGEMERDAARAMDEVALRLQARNWRAFFRDAAAGKALICLEGETMEVNRALCELTGYTENELLVTYARDIRHPDDRDRVDGHYQSILDGGPPVAGIEARYRHKAGHFLFCLLSLSLIRDSRGGPLYFTAEIEDITARRHAEAKLHEQTHELERANLELLRSNADLERFAFVASHDLQEPLRKIRVFGDRLQTLAARGEITDDFERYLEVMTRGAGRMQNLIDDLLAYGRLGNRARAFAPVDLNALWAELREEFADEMRESGVAIEVGALPVINGNEFRLRQLFCNLLSNALKFRGETPLIVKVKATHLPADEPGGARVAIEVQDNGIGFDQTAADAIFEVFVRLHGRERYPGTGIGLAICRRVAREHGGDLHAFSAPGQGARFVVTLAV